MAEKKIGRVTHYYDKIGVAILDLSAPLKMGEKITFKKGGEDIGEQTIESMQVEKEAVEKAKKGDVIGVHVDTPIKEGAEVYK